MFARWSTAAVLATALAVAPAHADPVANFYKRRQVDLIVGSGPGGGYDIYARLLARHLGKFIPGHPPIIVQNMPGGGSLRAVNFLYNLAPKDGTAIGTFTRNMPLIGLLGGNANVQFDPRKLTWLGSASSFVNDAYILIVRKDAQKSDAHQTNKNLLVSEDALVDTTPRLQILADDVKCTHGATIGQIDEDAMFYLRTRAISEEAARNLLIQAFVSEVLRGMSIDPIRAGLECLLFMRLRKGHGAGVEP